MDLNSMMSMDIPVPHEDGSFISERVSRVAELVREYDHHIDVRWIRPQDRLPNDPAFAIVYHNDDGSEYVIFYVDTEAEFDGSVLRRLQGMDQARRGGKGILNEIDATNEALKIITEARHKEQLEADTDLAYHILHSHKHNYKHDGIDYGKA